MKSIKGIILAGGTGSRLYPLTLGTSKQLLPVYDKPMIYYPLTTLMLAGIRDILIITNPQDQNLFKTLLGNGNQWGINLSYVIQKNPDGLAHAFILGEKFIGNNNVSLILGDNFFYGQNLSQMLLNGSRLKNGAKVILYKVSNPELFGVAKLNKSKKITAIKEKPKKFTSDLAITGLYFFDNKVVKYAKSLKPSKRGEVEIVDLLNFYKSKKQLSADIIGRGGAWLDTGSIEDFYKTSAFVSAIENRQGFKIACLEEIAFNKKWIGKKHIKKSVNFYGKCEYSNYLLKLLK